MNWYSVLCTLYYFINVLHFLPLFILKINYKFKKILK